MLHKFSKVKGFHIHAVDGEIGHVDDFLLDRNKQRRVGQYHSMKVENSGCVITDAITSEPAKLPDRKTDGGTKSSQFPVDLIGC